MTVHDTCFDDVSWLYPAPMRWYYLAMLRRNLRRAAHVLTVSEASRCRILELYGLAPSRVSIVYNTVEAEFDRAIVDASAVAEIRRRAGGDPLVLYPGGSDRRKNIGRLLDAFALLISSGYSLRLAVTEDANPLWERELLRHRSAVRERVAFLGRLTVPELKTYYHAADAVVYASLCEGFGRICLEAMAVGTPVACSDLTVLREVAGDYALYFDPTDSGQIAEVLKRAVCAGRLTPRRDDRFVTEAVASRFTTLMDELLLVKQ